jgi:DNA-binding response OmpR family regulator
MSDIRMSWQVLVVEADRVFAASLALKYGLHGHYAQFAQSGQQALELISRFEPTLAILGTELPDVTGVELAREIQTRFPSCWVVFLSDHPHARLLSRNTQPGHVGPDVLIKSVHPETIYEEVSQIVPVDVS